MLKKEISYIPNPDAEAGDVPAGQAEDGQHIRAFDNFGREIFIPKSEWQHNILPQQIKDNWDYPDGLYSAILMGLQDAYYADVLEAAERLLFIDTTPERSHTMLGVVLLNLNKLDEAEEVLKKYLTEHGPSGVIYTNLAQIQVKRGDKEKAEELLWEGIQVDPNQDTGLNWWGAFHMDRGGEEAFMDAMREAAKIDGSWRPQLWLARQCLEQKNWEEAKKYYEGVLASAGHIGDVIAMISGDCGINGYSAESLELLLPIYAPHQHGPTPGLNLLQSYLSLKDYQNGEVLLHHMFLMNYPNIKETLMNYSQAFEHLRITANMEKMPEIATSGEVQVGSVLLTDIMWYYALANPKWLLPEKETFTGEIGFLVFSNITQQGDGTAKLEQESDLGRITRAIPLFLSENFHLKTSLNTSYILPVIEGIGPLVYSLDWGINDIKSFAQSIQKELDYVVTGSIQELPGAEVEIQLHLWDMAKEEILVTFRSKEKAANLGRAISAFNKKLLNEFQTHWIAPPEHYDTAMLLPMLEEYLTAEGQLMMLLMVREGVVSRDGLWGERNIMEYFVKLALSLPDSPLPKIMLLSGLCINRSLGSKIYQEYQDILLSLLEHEEGTSPFFKMAPLIFELFDLTQERNEAIQNLLNIAESAGNEDPRYIEWLHAIQNFE